jgi:HEAT repeat protein
MRFFNFRFVRPKFKLRTLLVLVAVSALVIWGIKLGREGISEHWNLLKLQHGNPSTRRAVLDEIFRSELGSLFGGLFGDSTKPDNIANESGKALGRSRAQFWIGPLLEATNDADPLIRAKAIKGLVMMAFMHAKPADKKAIGRRVFQTVADSDSTVRATAIGEVYWFESQDPDAILPTLRNALKDPETTVRMAAAQSLWMAARQSPHLQLQATEELFKVLASRDLADVRKKAAWGLCSVGWDNRMRSHPGPDVIPALIVALSDTDTEVRKTVALLLRYTDFDSQSLSSISRWKSRRATILPALIAAKTDTDEAVRLEVALGLFQMGKRDGWTRTMIEKSAVVEDNSSRRQAAQSLQEWDKEEEELGLGMDP